jgi:antitoxin component of MazEF toxin-antitoxin module
MTKRLIQHGNSAALVIEKPILQLLGIDFDSELEVVTDGKNLIISPLKSKEAESDLLASLSRVNRNHGQTLEKLAH